MFPSAGDRAVASAMPVADDEKGVVMKSMGDEVLVHVIPQVAVEASANVFVNRLQLDEHQRQPIDETDEVRTPVVARRFLKSAEVSGRFGIFPAAWSA